jgi:GDPmannose 4,6-dehydratase
VSNPKVSLITGINGQDGIFLSRLLRSFNHIVIGIGNSSEVNNHVDKMVIYHQCDLRDTDKLIDLVTQHEVQEIYNLAAVSSVQQSFFDSGLTLEVNFNAVERLLNRLFSSKTKIGACARFFQASSSEMFGITSTEPQNEDLAFNPVSPYAVSKVKAFDTCRQFRDKGFHVSSAIMYNHESIYRPMHYVTRKISSVVAAIAKGAADKLTIGNLNAQRDWGYAPDYMHAAYLMLQQDVPSDYVIATGVVHSVQDLVFIAFEEVGLGGQESEFLQVDSSLMRPREISRLIGDASKARDVLGWNATKTFEEVFRDMVRHDLSLLKH